MSYLITPSFCSLKVDFLTPYNLNASGVFLLRAPASFDTDISATTGGTQITLYSGSSYYIEASVSALNGGRNGTATFQLYDATNAQYVGRDTFYNMNVSQGTAPRVSRKVASALILDSEISGSLNIEMRRTSQTGTGWDYFVYEDVGLVNLPYTGYPSIRVWQLPS